MLDFSHHLCYTGGMDKKNPKNQSEIAQVSPEARQLAQLNMTPEERKGTTYPHWALKDAIFAFRKETARGVVDNATRVFANLLESATDDTLITLPEQVSELRSANMTRFSNYMEQFDDGGKSEFVTRLKSPEYIYATILSQKTEWGGALSDGVDFILANIADKNEKRRYAMCVMTIADVANIHRELVRACDPQRSGYPSAPMIQTAADANKVISSTNEQMVGLDSIDRNSNGIFGAFKSILRGKTSVSPHEYKDIPDGCSFFVADSIIAQNRQLNHLENALAYLVPYGIRQSEVQGVVDALPVIKAYRPDMMLARDALEAYKNNLPDNDDTLALQNQSPAEQDAEEPDIFVAPSQPPKTNKPEIARAAQSKAKADKKAAADATRQKNAATEKAKRERARQKEHVRRQRIAQAARQAEKNLAFESEYRPGLGTEEDAWASSLNEQVQMPEPDFPNLAASLAIADRAESKVDDARAELVAGQQQQQREAERIKHISAQPQFNPTLERLIELQWERQKPTPDEQAAIAHDQQIWRRQRQAALRVDAEIGAVMQNFMENLMEIAKSYTDYDDNPVVIAERDAAAMATWEQIKSAAASLEFKTEKDAADSTAIRRQQNQRRAKQRQKAGLRTYWS